MFTSRINNRLVFKSKDEYRLELQTPDTMQLFSRTKKLMKKKTKNGENILSLEVVDVFLVKCNLVHNLY